MPNKAIKNNLFNTGNGPEKYTSLAMQESRLKKAKKTGEDTGDFTEFNRLGGDAKLSQLSNLIQSAQNVNKGGKKTAMNAGMENQFIKNHEKDQNANPTAVGGMPIMHKGSVSDKIMTGKERYNESLTQEISEIRYLMEYITTNKKHL